MALSPEARKKQAEYLREYRKKNKERVNEQQREYYAANKEKFKGYRERYWERQAAGQQE